MIGPLRTVPGMSPSATNRNASALPKNRVVALTTPVAAGELAITNLTAAGLRQGFGVTQEEIAAGRSGTVQRDGAAVIESDGSGTIAAGDLLYAVPNASVSLAGRVAKVAASPGTGEYLIVGHARTAAAASAGAEVGVELCTPYILKVA